MTQVINTAVGLELDTVWNQLFVLLNSLNRISIKMKLISITLLAMTIGLGSAVDMNILTILGEGFDPQEGTMNARFDLVGFMNPTHLYTAIDGGDKDLSPGKRFSRTIRATENDGINKLTDVKEIRFWWDSTNKKQSSPITLDKVQIQINGRGMSFCYKPLFGKKTIKSGKTATLTPFC